MSFFSNTNISASLLSSIYRAAVSCLVKHVDHKEKIISEKEVNPEVPHVHGQRRSTVQLPLLGISMLALEEVVSVLNTMQCHAGLLAWVLKKSSSNSPKS